MDQDKLPPGLTEFLKDFPRVEITTVKGYEPSIQAVSSSNPSGGSTNPPGPTSTSSGNVSGNKCS